jgi:hypothetical protein
LALDGIRAVSGKRPLAASYHNAAGSRPWPDMDFAARERHLRQRAPTGIATGRKPASAQGPVMPY